MKKIALFLSVLFFFSCANEMQQTESSFLPDDTLQMEEDLEIEPPRTAEPPPPPDAKIIRRATLNIEVEDYKKSRATLDDLLSETNANITNEVENDLSHQARNILRIRVQPNNFFSLIKKIESLAYEVKYKEVSAQDVGEEFYDLETRLATKKAVVKRYREILKQAKNIKEILDVEERIRVVVEEIESTQGRLKYLSNQVKHSSIELTMIEFKPTPAFAKVGFFGRMGKAFISGWNGLQEVVLIITHFWAFIAIFGLMGFLFLRRKKRV